MTPPRSTFAGRLSTCAPSTERVRSGPCFRCRARRARDRRGHRRRGEELRVTGASGRGWFTCCKSPAKPIGNRKTPGIKMNELRMQIFIKLEDVEVLELLPSTRSGDVFLLGEAISFSRGRCRPIEVEQYNFLDWPVDSAMAVFWWV